MLSPRATAQSIFLLLLQRTFVTDTRYIGLISIALVILELQSLSQVSSPALIDLALGKFGFRGFKLLRDTYRMPLHYSRNGVIEDCVLAGSAEVPSSMRRGDERRTSPTGGMKVLVDACCRL